MKIQRRDCRDFWNPRALIMKAFYRKILQILLKVDFAGALYYLMCITIKWLSAVFCFIRGRLARLRDIYFELLKF